MISREKLLPSLTVGVKLLPLYDKFHSTDEGILTVEEVDPINFTVCLKKENGARIIKVLGASYLYNFDENVFEIFHNDRVSGWLVTEKYKIVTGG